MSTIHFYIILKQRCKTVALMEGLSTIHFYIILKRFLFSLLTTPCLSTIHFYIILKLPVSIEVYCIGFEYHTFLHHSQTGGKLGL